MVGQQSQALGVVGGQERGRAAEERRRGRDVAARERASARRGEPPGAVLTDRAAPFVERAELREIRPGLLEVVAEDLLELGAAVRFTSSAQRRTARGDPRGRA